jgi:hypothetical protein
VTWHFDKEGMRLRYEMTREGVTGPYRLVVTHPDGRVSVEEIDDASELLGRSMRFVNALKSDGWRIA